MNVGFLILILFLLVYFAFVGAIMYHLNIYSFSRQTKSIPKLFIAASVILALWALFLYWRIEWGEILKVFDIIRVVPIAPFIP